MRDGYDERLMTDSMQNMIKKAEVFVERLQKEISAVEAFNAWTHRYAMQPDFDEACWFLSYFHKLLILRFQTNE